MTDLPLGEKDGVIILTKMDDGMARMFGSINYILLMFGL